MAESVVRDKAETDEERDGGDKSSEAGPSGAVAISQMPDEGRDEAWDEKGEEDQACGGGVPVEGLFDEEGENGVP